MATPSQIARAQSATGISRDRVAFPPPGGITIARDHAHLHMGDVVHNHFIERKATAFSIDSLSIADSTCVDIAAFTTAILALVTRATNSLKSCQRQAARMKLVDYSIASLHIDCSTIRFRLAEIQKLLAKADDRPPEEVFESHVLEQLEHVLQTSRSPLSMLNTQLGAVCEVAVEDRDAFKARLQQFQDNPQVEMAGKYLGTLNRAIDVLTPSFRLNTRQMIPDIRTDQKSKHILESLDNDAISLHESLHSDTNVAAEATRVSMILTQSSDFNEILSDTPIYRRAYLRNIIRQQGIEDEVDRAPDEVVSGWSDDGSQLPVFAQTHTGGASATANLNTYFTDAGDAAHPWTEWRTGVSQLNKEVFDVRAADVEAISSDQTTMRRASLDSVSSGDTVRDAVTVRTRDANLSEQERLLSHSERLESATSAFQELPIPPPQVPIPSEASKYPTLSEVLTRKSVKPYGLFEFYIYMKDQQRAVDYLDFWLDVTQHTSLCRKYVRELRNDVMSTNRTEHTIARADLRASAERILYTYLLRGSEREIFLPQSLLAKATEAIEEDGRDDPDVFSETQDYVFQAMDRDAFPGFLNWSRPVVRMFRWAPIARNVVQGLTAPKYRYPSRKS